MAYSNEDDDKSLLEKLDAIAPLKEFDAFPKVANSYTKHTTLGAVATVVVILMSFLLSLNDIGEFVWGWPDFEYSVDRRLKSTLDINLDMVVNMPCMREYRMTCVCPASHFVSRPNRGRARRSGR